MFVRDLGQCPVCERHLAITEDRRVWRHDPASPLMRLVSCAGSWRPATDILPQQLELEAVQLALDIATGDVPAFVPGQRRNDDSEQGELFN